MMKIGYPALKGNEGEQLAQIKRYLFQLADILNYNFDLPGNGSKESVLTINQTAGKTNYNADDFIESSGTSNGWTYRKWNSGIIELWTKSLSHTIAWEQVGPVYMSSFDNISVPLVTEILFVSGDALRWRYANWSSATVKSESLSISIRYYGVNTNDAGETLNFQAYVIGKWK